jgi:competence protein ComGC
LSTLIYHFPIDFSIFSPFLSLFFFFLKIFLVELLIVIVIIGILMSALLPRLSGAQDIARDTARGVAISQIQTAIMSYRSLHGKWPTNEATGTKNLTILVRDNLLTEVP